MMDDRDQNLKIRSPAHKCSESAFVIDKLSCLQINSYSITPAIVVDVYS